jgi:hypothetical protein
VSLRGRFAAPDQIRRGFRGHVDHRSQKFIELLVTPFAKFPLRLHMIRLSSFMGQYTQPSPAPVIWKTLYPFAEEKLAQFARESFSAGISSQPCQPFLSAFPELKESTL